MLLFQELGISKNKYGKILDEADRDGKGSISQVELGTYLLHAVETGNLTKPQAEAVWRSMNWSKSFDEGMRDADFVREHGDEYEQYGLTVAQAQFYYSTAKGKVSLERYSAQVDNYGIDRVKAFYGMNGWAQTGLTIEQYDSYATAAAKCKGTDNDGDGKTDAYSVMYQKFAVINALPVSNAIKDAICQKEGWAERNIAKAPWH